MAESTIAETDDPDYQMAFAALDELKLAARKPFFEEHCLQDDTLFFMKNEEELRNFLVKELKLPFGQGFKFSRLWFHKYHKNEGTLHSGSPVHAVAPPKAEKPPEVATKTSQVKNEFRGSPFESSPTSKNAKSPVNSRSPISGDEVRHEAKGSRDISELPTKQNDEKDENAISHLAEFSSKDSKVHPSHPAEKVVANATPTLSSCEAGHQKARDLLSRGESFFIVDTSTREPKHTYAVEESHQMGIDIEGEVPNVQHNMYVDDNSLRQQRPASNQIEQRENATEGYPFQFVGPETEVTTNASEIQTDHTDGAVDNRIGLMGLSPGAHGIKQIPSDHCLNSIANEKDTSFFAENKSASLKITTSEGQDQSIMAAANEVLSTKAPVDDWFEDEACGKGKTVLPAWMPDSWGGQIQGLLPLPMMGSEKAETEIAFCNTKTDGKKEVSEIDDQSNERSNERHKEQASLKDEAKDLRFAERNPCRQEYELELERPQVEETGQDVSGEDQRNLDKNNNSTNNTDHDITIRPTIVEPVTAKKSSCSAPLQTGNEIFRDIGFNGEIASDGNEQISNEVPCQNDEEPGERSHLPERDYQEVSQVDCKKCTPRPLGVKGKEVTYQTGFVLDAEENKEVEFKSLTSAQHSLLPWKIMEKAKKFICACLNADSKGIIYFGVADSQEQSSKFKRGEILGLDVEDAIDDIMKAFQFLLDDHIKSDAGPLQKGGEQNCVNLEFVPVISEGSRTSLYVIEIEVNRDWKFCKDNIYYSKCWTEKRGVKMEKGHSIKKALSDLYKVHKDEFDDVAIRTNGASTNVKQHEVNRQVKEPLIAKFKEWKKKQKIGQSESAEDSSADDSDVKRFSAQVRERLRDMNFKDFGYILITNKLPPKYRGTPHLAFLQNIPWLAVFDLFDSASKKDGLHYVCNETTDAPRAKLRSLDDFKDASSDWVNGKELNLSTRGTTWILSNEEMQKGNWIKCSRHCFYQALFAYKHCCPPGKLLCVFLGLDENGVQEMVDMMECCFSILGNSAGSCVTIISESKHVAEAFIKASKLQREIRECSISGIPWRLLKEIVREMVGPTKFEERGATTELPYFTGGLKEVLNKAIHSWDDLEVYTPNPRLPRLAEDIEKERKAFYKGAQASQTNLFHNHCIPRTLEEETNLKIEQALNTLSKPSKDVTCQVKTVTVPYEPGSGATTMCRRILWNKRNEFRCAVVKAVTPATDYQIEQLQGIVYDDKNLKFAPPCLILVDNFPENETRRLTEKIINRKIKCVILSTFPIAKFSSISDVDVTVKQLDENEMSLVKDILINITNDSRRRRGAEEVLERERRFIWFGLELFGREYNKIEERLQNHINSTLDAQGDSQDIHEMVLNFCCFLHYYSNGRAILPHPVVSDFLYEASNEKDEECALMASIHKTFGGLLLEGFNETNGYYGWRPAHSLVSEVVTSRINIEDTAVLLLEKIYKGKAYVNKFLKEQVLKVFLDRKRISDPVLMERLETDDESIDSDFESEVVGFYEVRTRYSPLIVDILEEKNGIQRALRLLITICQKASETEKAYAWQQLARFMGYEMRANKIDAKDDLHHRLHLTMKKEQEVKLPMPATGIEAAHMAIDIAIDQQRNYSHHYVTKGTLYLLQLRDFKPGERCTQPSLMPEVIDICRKALDVYDKALTTTHTLNLYSMIGKIQAIVSLLEIVKGLPFLRLDRESITRYLKKAEIPGEMKETLTMEEHSYVQGLSTTTLDLLNELFRDMKLRQMTTYDENEIRGLNNAKIRASKLRRTFYEVTGFDRTDLSEVEVPTLSQSLTKDAPAMYQQIVQDILFKHEETPYSPWTNLSDGEVCSIYNLLKLLCLRGYAGHDDMLICCKACLRLKERPPVVELDQIVSKWLEKYPDSEWAHLFHYMIHFPIPNGSLAAFSHSAKESIKKCDKIVRNKTGTGFRKSGAEYFLGKGIGLYAIASSQEFRWLETKWEDKTAFWRSKDISEKLERVCGQKDVNFNGVITYHGIQLRFDNTRYPYQSKDDLWFYVGFSVAGPYAYDPVDNDTYAIVTRKTSESSLLEFPLIEAANAKSKASTPVSRCAKLRELKNAITRRQQTETADATPELSPTFSDFPCSKRAGQRQSISASMPHFLNELPGDTPLAAGNTAPSTSSANIPAMRGVSSWVSTDALHRPTSSPSGGQSYASALQLGGPRREDQMAKAAGRQSSGSRYSLRGKGSKWKVVEGSQGQRKQQFQPMYVDTSGRLHHGAFVLGAKKSKECSTHTNEAFDITTTKRCGFAHSWRGDTLQYVCQRCTLQQGCKGTCRKRSDHEAYIWNLGPYYNEHGMIWKGTGQELK